MRIYKYPQKNEYQEIIKRNSLPKNNLRESVSEVLNDVRSRGDVALTYYTEKFDGIKKDNFKVSAAELSEQANKVPDDLKKAVIIAKENIEKFHRAQILEEERIETTEGVLCWRKSIPIESIGLYIPGGSAPLFSTLLMLGIPAKIAGCKKIIVTTPPQSDGTINTAIACVLKLLEFDQVFLVGGAQAVGALAYGTQTIPKVSKIFGPGNQYVTVAKQLVVEDKVAIDLPAGPSEVAVICDETANPAVVAADLISQAEHGEDSIVMLVTTSEKQIDAVQYEIDKQLLSLPRAKIAKVALEFSKIILVEDVQTAFEIINLFAPEHLIISTKNSQTDSELVINAGSVFIGEYSAESFGDYASGTNHVLPTDGYAVNYSGVSVDSFVKKITFQEIAKQGLENLGKVVVELARAEGLEGHARAILERFKGI